MDNQSHETTLKLTYSQHDEAFLIMAMFTRERYRTVIVTGLIFGTEKLTVHTGPVLGPIHMGTLSNISRQNKQIKAVTSCNTHRIDQQETDG